MNPFSNPIMAIAEHYVLTSKGSIKHPFTFNYWRFSFWKIWSKSQVYSINNVLVRCRSPNQLFPTNKDEPTKMIWMRFGDNLVRRWRARRIYGKPPKTGSRYRSLFRLFKYANTYSPISYLLLLVVFWDWLC